MKKCLRYLVMSMMALCLCVPALSSAEAATVALLPLINNVEGGDEMSSTIYFQEAIAALHDKPEFMMVENDKLSAAIDKVVTVNNALPSEADLRAIAKDGDVDLVIVMKLDKLEDSPIESSEERWLQLDMQGYAIAYNRLTDKFYEHRIFSDKTIQEALTSRWDWVHEEWGRQVRVEVDRILRAK